MTKHCLQRQQSVTGLFRVTMPHGFVGFTNRDLRIIALRSNGVRADEVAARLGFKIQQAYDLTHDVYLNAGFRSVELMQWAKANAYAGR